MRGKYIGREKFTKEDLESLSMPIPECGCWLWLRTTSAGYGRIHKYIAHRLSWELYNGPVPKGLCVLHKCDVPSCVNPTHLFLGTKKDNTMDMLSKGRMKIPKQFGENHWGSKLTPNMVIAIRHDPRSQRQIARSFGICQQTVFNIKHRKTWALLP